MRGYEADGVGVRSFFLLISLAIMTSPVAHVAGATCLSHFDCADGDFCNGIEQCVAGICVGAEPIPCDDGDPCTADFCVAEVGCGHSEELCPADCTGQPDGQRCADGSTCTTGDACSGGTCVPGPPPDCADADGCTSAGCDPAFGCVYSEEFVSAPCVPNCTGSVADFTRCPGDDDICTIDACLPSADFTASDCIAGLLFGRQCSDGDACNGDEWCSPILGCQAGPALACDDGEICNGGETCDAASGCQAGTDLPDGTPCDDGLLCTGDDACSQGGCVGQPLAPADCSDSDPATADQCREGLGCLNCTTLETRRFRIRFSGTGSQNGKLKARGSFVLSAGGNVSPATEVVVLIFDLDGDEIYRTSVPAGALPQAAVNWFRFRDGSGELANGLRRMALRTRDGSAFDWKATAKGLFQPAQATALDASLVVGDDCFAGGASCTDGGAVALSCRP